MSNKPLHIGEEAAVQMPMKTVVSLIIIVALGTMGYFQIVERLNIADTRLQLMEKDLTENTDFRIKWPRGQLGSLPADSEQFMLIEDLYKQVEKLQQNIEMTNPDNFTGHKEAPKFSDDNVEMSEQRKKTVLKYFKKPVKIKKLFKG